MVFTIHNAEFGLDRIGMAAYYSQRFTTVSPTYAYEVVPYLCRRLSRRGFLQHPPYRDAKAVVQ